ncbi:MAG TPA: LuxR C-terminal-related transcriptional regulator [Bacillota bacterium]|nr:LuxR C-terminal-related transcriptional regulator [Bacillota bacterium]HQI16967.1 LuxR C-terminal-related transcriptional regulator [Bacillota bacterium]HQJ37482.1 LuxR C-terminal-related transcriptional regulator [Bacillota bacterium]
MLRNKRSLTVIAFSSFSSWLLSFLFGGQVLLTIAGINNVNINGLTFGSIAAHFIGLFVCGFFIKSIKAAKGLMLFSIPVCILGTIVFFFVPSIMWHISLLILSFLSGACVAAWGFYFKMLAFSYERIKIIADVLIYSNILMVIINTAAVLISSYLGLALSILMLSISLFFHTKLAVDQNTAEERHTRQPIKAVSPIKPLAFLCLFIVIITINSGLMYQVINPAFAHHEWLVSWYWALPYIAALYIVRNLSGKANRSYILYVAIAMIGLSSVGFMMLDRSAASYLIIDTLMLGACGVYDLFWWSILGEMLDYHDNPAKILGIGLSANVFGVLIGGMIGSTIADSNTGSIDSSVLALVVVFIVLIILPLLHKHLSGLLKNHIFLTALSEIEPSKQKKAIENFAVIGQLTERESEIAALLLKGRTYKMIADELYLSENTIKTHIKNIYSKFNIQSKTELIKLLTEKETP